MTKVTTFLEIPLTDTDEIKATDDKMKASGKYYSKVKIAGHYIYKIAEADITYFLNLFT